MLILALLISTLVAVVSDDANDLITDESKSELSLDVGLLGKVVASLPRVVPVMGSDDAKTSDGATELGEVSDRPVACAKMLVGTAMSESIDEELVLAAPSTMLALIVSIKLEALSAAEAGTILEGTSVAEEKVDMSVMPSEGVVGRVDVSDSESKVIDGTSVASETALAGTELDMTTALLDIIEIIEDTS